MSAFVYRKSDQRHTTWSGGTTTELSIFPPATAYSERNFLFRVSTATTEVEETRFTELPGFSRILMVLEGVLDITHTNRYSLTLNPGDTDSFHGSWETTGKGKVRDFNLMLGKGCRGSLGFHTLSAQETSDAKSEEHALLGCYVVTGMVSANDGTREQTLEAGDWIGFEQPQNSNRLLLHARSDSTLVLVHVNTV